MITEHEKYRAKQGAFAGALAGVLLSQYRPLWGSVAQLAAEPWSPARKTLIGMHAIPVALLFALVGLLIERRREQSLTDKWLCGNGVRVLPVQKVQTRCFTNLDEQPAVASHIEQAASLDLGVWTVCHGVLRWPGASENTMRKSRRCWPYASVDSTYRRLLGARR